MRATDGHGGVLFAALVASILLIGVGIGGVWRGSNARRRGRRMTRRCGSLPSGCSVRPQTFSVMDSPAPVSFPVPCPAPSRSSCHFHLMAG